MTIAHISPLGSVPIAEGEVVPVAITIDAGPRFRVSLPLGAYTQREGKTQFTPTIDVVGLVAVVMGIGVGAMTVRAAGPVLRAVATRIASAR